MKNFKLIMTICLVMGVLVKAVTQPKSTHWDIRTSAALDAWCLLNTLTGDDYYRQFYPMEYEKWIELLNCKNDSNIQSLYRLKTEMGITLSAGYTYMLGYTPDTTVTQLCDRFKNDFESIKKQLQTADYYNPQAWMVLESQKQVSIGYLELLCRANYDSIYYHDIYPEIRNSISAIQTKVAQYDIIPYIESFIDEELASDTVTLFLMNYNQPHGICIGKNRYITYHKYDINIIVNNAIHELLHPIINKYVTELDLVNSLEKDVFIYNAFENHDKVFGYNSFEAAIEESCVRFLDQVISEKIGTGRNPIDRWMNEDDGMHVFAAILYQVYNDLSAQKITFETLLHQVLIQCKENGGKAIYEKLYKD